MKTHRMLVITSLVLVALLITTGVAFAQGSSVDQAIDHIVEGDFSTNNNVLTMGDAATGGREKNPISGINSTIADGPPDTVITVAGERFPPSSDVEIFFNDIDLGLIDN
jgi:hypothetical protein